MIKISSSKVYHKKIPIAQFNELYKYYIFFIKTKIPILERIETKQV